jgi:chromosome segregation ATPase
LENGQNPTLQLIWNELKDMHQSLSGKIEENKRLIKGNGRRIDELVERVDDNSARIDNNSARIDNLNTRISQMEIKLSTEITAIAGTVNDTNRLLKGYNHRLTRVERKTAHLPDPGAI